DFQRSPAMALEPDATNTLRPIRDRSGPTMDMFMKSTLITYAFFTGAGNLLKDFTISAPNPAFTPRKEDAGRYKVIKLIPKENKSQVSEIHLWVTPDSLIQRMEILDHFETKTTLEFSNLETNTLPTDDPKAMDALFSFTPPEGTEIIYQ
ncbi:MAG: outer membrane lipoprotein carrier protein LolA, partial [Proteobacteria bacterium]|nr:outer membrane lipoprotein carrier protein LolA [Pseudomonadota bacterium]